MLIIQRYLSLLIAICLSACSPQTMSNGGPNAGASLQQLIAIYGTVEDPVVREYFEYLQSRLISAVESISEQRDRGQTEGSEYNWVLLGTAEPVALFLAPRYVVLSKGLLTQLQSEAELAFILGHELAHHQLRHDVRSDGKCATCCFLPNPEIAADAYAVKVLSRAGYNPKIAPFALRRAYHTLSSDIEATDTSHPSLAERLIAVNQVLSETLPAPMGTIGRRDFDRMQLVLRRE